MNSDITCSYPLKELLEYHKKHGKEVSTMTTIVEDPSKYGVCVVGEEGKVIKFSEKPKEFLSNKINVGLYVMNCSIIDKIGHIIS